jgi:hypothetical protein
MTFEVSLPFQGVAGWKYLQATEARQKEAFSQIPSKQRDIAYFRETLPNIRSVDDFVGDRRLLRVALGAFGLEADIANQAFVRAVIEGGVEKDDALANRLADKRYLDFASVLSAERLSGKAPFDGPATELIVQDYLQLQFEASVGTSNSDLRVALALERELGKLAGEDISSDAKYFRILGNPPLRLAFETAFGLPSGFSGIDIDQQVEILKDAVSNRFGISTLDQFQDDRNMQTLAQLYLVRSSVSSFGQMSPGQTALRILTA